jgi:MoaD family protein
VNSVRVKVVYFAQARESAGTKEEEFVLTQPAYVDHLYSLLMKAHPELVRIKDIIRIMVNGRTVLGNVELKDEDRVALLPPVAGG